MPYPPDKKMPHGSEHLAQEPLAEDFFLHELAIKDTGFKKRRKSDWVENSFIDFNDQELFQSNKNYLGLGMNRQKLKVFFGCILVLVGLLFSRSAYLQIIKGDEYLQAAESNRIRVYHVQSPRGIIYDRQQKQLVNNIPDFALLVSPVDFPKKIGEQQALIRTLQGYFPEHADEIKEKVEAISTISQLKKEYYQPLEIIKNIDYERAIKLRVASSSLPGISIEVNNRRFYITSGSTDLSSMSHLLGYVGKINRQEYVDLQSQGYLFNDVIGKTGLEHFYEKSLRGIYGTKQIEVDSLGKELKVLAREEVQKGDNLIISIDLTMQEKLESLLKSALMDSNQHKAVGIVQNPQNGEILAMVSLPGFDNNLFAGGIDRQSYQSLLDNEDKPLFNRAVSGEYPSGSTIKPIFAAGALQDGMINSTTSFLSTGGIRIDQWFFPDWRAGGHGQTTVKKALADSVNTFFYIIGGGYQDFKGLGVRRLKEIGEWFGLSQLTGIDLPHESAGFLPSPEWKEQVKAEKWYIGDTYHMVIGQGDVLVTPLQVNNYTATIANGGTLYEPHLIKSIIKAQDGSVEQYFPVVKNENFIDRANLEIVRQGMRQAVTSGSARALSSLPVAVAGKTGTAQWGVDRTPHAWFTAFAPYENSELAITLLLESAGEGSEVAVPVANRFLYWYFTEY